MSGLTRSFFGLNHKDPVLLPKIVEGLTFWTLECQIAFFGEWPLCLQFNLRILKSVKGFHGKMAFFTNQFFGLPPY